MADARPDRWDGAAEYESYIGRWSRPVAERFVDWLDVPAGRAWLDVGCGTGALTAAIAGRAAPASVTALDLSAEFVASAAHDLDDRRVVFLVGDARALPLADAQLDVVVSGLVLNFLGDPVAAVAEWRRTARPGGTVAVFVWDYADAMEPIRAFWDAAIELAPADREADEAVRLPVCAPARLRGVLGDAGLHAVETHVIEGEARFRDFDDYWTPFLRGIGPAPGYCAALPPDRREALRAVLHERLAPSGGPFVMRTRAYAVRASVPPLAVAPALH
jgi:SAM-dependent methyltransferase